MVGCTLDSHLSGVRMVTKDLCGDAVIRFSMNQFLSLSPKVEGGYVFTPVCLFVCLCAGYRKKLWMDSDEILWAGWVCDYNELIRFW